MAKRRSKYPYACHLLASCQASPSIWGEQERRRAARGQPLPVHGDQTWAREHMEEDGAQLTHSHLQEAQLQPSMDITTLAFVLMKPCRIHLCVEGQTPGSYALPTPSSLFSSQEEGLERCW